MHRHDVGRDVLALGAVAAGGRLHEAPPIVSERDGEPVDLGLRRELDARIGGKTEETAHARYKIDDVVLAEGVAEREHRRGVAHLAEGLHRRRANALGGTVGAHMLGKACLNGSIALAQGIVVGVGDLGRVLGIIEEVVMGDLAREPLELAVGFRDGELIDNLVGRRLDLHARETASAAPRNPDPIGGLPAASRR